MVEFGRVRHRLAALLQSSFPVSVDGMVLTWKPERLYPATGAYRTNHRLDSYRWEGYGVYIDGDGIEHPAMDVASHLTMSQLIRSKRLKIAREDEVVPDDHNLDQEHSL